MEYPDLSKRQAQILDFIKEYISTNQMPPSVREIGEAIGLSSPSSVHVHLKVLEDKGYLHRRESRSRGIAVTDKGKGKTTRSASAKPASASRVDLAMMTLPLVGDVAAGTPILAEQNIQERVSMPVSLMGDTGSFLLTVKGDSMINAGILSGDVVVVRESQTANNGDIVVALLEDGATVKTYYKEKDCIRLQPQNDSMEPIFTNDVAIMGVVIGLFRHF